MPNLWKIIYESFKNKREAIDLLCKDGIIEIYIFFGGYKNMKVSFSREIVLNTDYDVIVVGGGPSGCTSAIAAAREGAKTLLIEATGMLGGMGTAGLVPAWCPFSDGEKTIYRGLAQKIFEMTKSRMNVINQMMLIGFQLMLKR